MLLWQARMELLMVLICCLTGALVMRVCHTIDPVFDDPNLIGFGGLPAVMSLAERAGLHELVDQHVTVPGSAGANAAVKVAALVAGMVVGADSISDLRADLVQDALAMAITLRGDLPAKVVFHSDSKTG